MQDPTLTKLNTIPAYGRQLFNGQHYKYKQRCKLTDALAERLAILKRRYPELLVYTTSKNYVIFGGTFSQSSNFMYELKFLMSVKQSWAH